MATDPFEKTPTGLPVDKFGGPTIDPTKNVLDLVESAIRRIDDLREAETTRINDLIKHSFSRVEDLRKTDNEAHAAARAHISEVAALREQHLQTILSIETAHYKELMIAEAKRIDAIRVVDVQAVQTANEKATAQASVLATQVTQSADTLRTLVSTNAASLATQLTQIITPITDRLALLEKAQYEGAGKSGVTDPQMSQLIREMQIAREAMAQGMGRTDRAQEGRVNMTTLIGILIATVGMIGGIVTLIVLLNRPTAPVTAPVVERVIISPPTSPSQPDQPSATVVPNSYQQ